MAPLGISILDDSSCISTRAEIFLLSASMVSIVQCLCDNWHYINIRRVFSVYQSAARLDYCLLLDWLGMVSTTHCLRLRALLT